MEKSIYKILESERNKKNSHNNDEYTFFVNNKHFLKENTYFSSYASPLDAFDLIKSNIIIRALKNKEEIEEMILSKESDKNIDLKLYIKEKCLDFPSIQYENLKIYFPFFSKITNNVYVNEVERLNDEPYNALFQDYSPFLVNPFDTYGVDLFDSTFTRLIKIDEDLTTVAFYSYYLSAILIINKQGGLDNVIYLFDKHLKHPNKSHIIDRVKALTDSYYKNNIHDFVYTLYKNEFISYKVFKKICKAKKI